MGGGGGGFALGCMMVLRRVVVTSFVLAVDSADCGNDQ